MYTVRGLHIYTCARLRVSVVRVVCGVEVDWGSRRDTLEEWVRCFALPFVRGCVCVGTELYGYSAAV